MLELANLARLHTLETDLDLLSRDSGKIQLPSTLVCVRLKLRFLGGSQLARLIRSVCKLPLMRSLSIHIPAQEQLHTDFASLCAAPQLQDLVIHTGVDSRNPADISDEQIAALRSLTRLRVCDITMSTAAMRRLLQSGHGLQWQQIGEVANADAAAGAALATLPSLTRLELRDPHMVDFLPKLPGLQWLRLTQGAIADNHADNYEPPTSEALACALSQCHSLTAIELITDCRWGSKWRYSWEVEALLKGLENQLRELRITSPDESAWSDRELLRLATPCETLPSLQRLVYCHKGHAHPILCTVDSRGCLQKEVLEAD